jgi:hypothetical protein
VHFDCVFFQLNVAIMLLLFEARAVNAKQASNKDWVYSITFVRARVTDANIPK